MPKPLFLLVVPAAFATLLLPLGEARAQGTPDPAPVARAARPLPDSCRTAAGDSAILDCVERLGRAEERRLDAAVEKLSTDLRREPRRRQLVRSQRLWREYRDAQCEYVSLSVRQGASPDHLAGAQCLLAETTRRVEEVAHMVPPALRRP